MEKLKNGTKDFFRRKLLLKSDEKTFTKLCEVLRLRLRISHLRKPVSVEKQIATVLHYLQDEERVREIGKSFVVGKSTVSLVVCRGQHLSILQN